MELLSTSLQPFFDWLLHSSIQAGIVICLILLIQGVLRGRLTIRWHYVLWLILIVRMVLPLAPQSRFSIFNLVTNLLRPAMLNPSKLALNHHNKNKA
jgi:beta-lactamase regulating signal transducer with metallopeptidase domain